MKVNLTFKILGVPDTGCQKMQKDNFYVSVNAQVLCKFGMSGDTHLWKCVIKCYSIFYNTCDVFNKVCKCNLKTRLKFFFFLLLYSFYVI